jgi:hypothetical protein
MITRHPTLVRITFALVCPVAFPMYAQSLTANQLLTPVAEAEKN